MAWLTWLYVFIEILGIAAALYAVLGARTSQGATAWAVALIAMPVIALPAFAVFGGRTFQGYVSKRRSSDERLDYEWKEFKTYFDQARCFKKGESRVIDAFETLAGLPFTRARRVRLLRDGDEFFPELLRVLRHSRRFIEFQFYIVRDDQIGTEIAQVLMQKAAEGVKVRVLYDMIGSNKTSDEFFKRLRGSGVEVASFVSTRWRWSRPHFQINFRNHRKLVNVDGEYLFVGGMNIGDDYLSRYPEIGHWRDTQVLIEGSAAVQAQQSFAADWFWSTGKVIDFELSRAEKPPEEGGVPALILATSPTSTRESASLALLNAIESAQSRLWITSPYLVPDETLVAALQLAVLRGVDVRLLVTDKTDMLVTQLASYTFFDELIPYGVKIYLYRKENGLMHQKVILVDDQFSYVGSTNIDNRSIRLNFEIGAWMHGSEVASQVEQMLRQDFARSELVSMDIIHKMPRYRRLLSGLSRLLAPAL